MTSPSSFQRALLSSVFTAFLANAYNEVSFPSPFMYKNIDPIVFPNQYAKSHLHSFYGSDAVTIYTKKSARLRTGCMDGDNPNDLSTYWTPTVLYQNGGDWEPVPVMRFSAYYGLGDNPAEIPIPENLKMVAGNASATNANEAPPEAFSQWFCEGGPDSPLDANGFPSETCSTHLQQLIYFPNCVNTDTLETAYKDGEPGSYHDCPSGMSAIPQLRFSIRYDLRSVLPDGWSGTAPLQLACGNAYCSHGDFFNGWYPDAAQSLVEATQEKAEFVSVSGALGSSGDTMNCEPTDADPNHGQSTYAGSVAVMH